MFKKRKLLTEMTDEEINQLTDEELIWYDEHYPEDSAKWREEVERKFNEYVDKAAQKASWYITDADGQLGIVGGVEALKEEIGESDEEK